MRYPSGKYFEGEFKEGKKEGKGKMIYPDGSLHEGVWQSNKKCGIGKFTDK